MFWFLFFFCFVFFFFFFFFFLLALQEFAKLMFEHCEALRPLTGKYNELFEHFRSWKGTIPTAGASGVFFVETCLMVDADPSTDHSRAHYLFTARYQVFICALLIPSMHGYLALPYNRFNLFLSLAKAGSHGN